MATSWIQDEINPVKRGWEEFYRNRWQYDKMVRSTHGNNCTGGCSWMVYVKDGVITWELQAVDYPKLEQSLPPYEPRGCQRGISASWYVYSPVRIKYPYIRGTVLDAWKEARAKHADPVDAWKSIVDNAELHKKIKWSRGKGGFRRGDWDTAAEIITSAHIHTIKTWGPDRIISFSPIPAMSQISYAAGARYHQMLGGISMSFYDYYTDLPPASPEVWGEQTDVAESADWFHAGYVVIMGACLNMTRTADCHFIPETKFAGNKVVVLSPDYSQVSKYADLWVPVKPGSDGALWLAINHVILKEFFVDRQVPYFDAYNKHYTDMPQLVKLAKGADGWEMGRLLRACELSEYADTDNAEWKFAMWDTKTNKARIVNGGMGYRYPQNEESKGKWNTLLKDGKTGEKIDPALSVLDIKDDALEVNFYELDKPEKYKRQVPVKYVETKDGRVPVCTVFDLNIAHVGVARAGLGGDYCSSYDDDRAHSPAWQEKYTGIGRDTVIQVAREFASNAEVTKGRSMVICGASINHWYHANLIYRAYINALMLCGCEGRNGGGMNHYVGQERLAPFDSWGQIALGLDWRKPPRLMNAPSQWYFHTQQWKYDSAITDYHNVPDKNALDYQHTADYNAWAVRMGWLPWYPTFNKSSIAIAEDAEKAGAKTNAEIIDYVVKQIKSGGLDYTVHDPDAPENWPRVWMIWRGNALGSSARGQEYFFKFLLGTHNNVLADEAAKPFLKDVKFRESPLGKLDLLVDLNLRMNTTPTYCDIVLPAAHWYEKEDINTTDMHSYIHPMGAAVPPNWEAKSDWDAYKFLAKKFSEQAKKHFPKPVKDVVATPLGHDSPGEIAQPALDGVLDWKKGECDVIPGKTTQNLAVVERDYTNVYNMWTSFGPNMRGKFGFHGIMVDGKEFYEGYISQPHTEVNEWGGEKYISLNTAKEAANCVMGFSSLTNGEVAYRAWVEEEHHTGLHGEAYHEAREAATEVLGDDIPYLFEHAHGLADELAGPERNVSMTYDDIVAQPRRWLTSPLWSGDVRRGRSYAGWTIQLEHRTPWRTLTGRQHFYLDHPIYIQFGEALCSHKYKLNPAKMNEVQKSDKTDALHLNYITPHGKWQIHSMHYDNLRMLTLSRGGNSCWVNDRDAESVGIRDNDWVEAYNDNGVFVCRAVVSARIPSGTCFAYHSMERTVNVPKAEQRNKIRGGFHNSLTRQRLKPNLMIGGYGQFSWGFNAWGPIPIIRDTTVLVRKMRNQEVKW
ncbi:MAG: nitrate reductase subunit alpha [Thermodesulfobacteriota bacterium]